MKYGQPENHNESEVMKKYSSKLNRDYSTTYEQFHTAVVSAIRSHRDLIKMATHFQCSVSTINRWALGTSRPHPGIYDIVIKGIKDFIK